GGAKTPPIDDIIGRSKYQPRQMWTGSHARTISTISSSRLITTCVRALQDAEAQSSSMRQGKDLPRPRVALHWKSIPFARFFPVWDRAPELSLSKTALYQQGYSESAGLFCTFAKNRGTDAEVGGAERYCRGEVGTHSHRQELQAVAVRNLCGERKMRARRFVNRRNAHKTGNL